MYLIPKPKEINLKTGKIYASSIDADFGALLTEQVANALSYLADDMQENCPDGETLNITAEIKKEYTNNEEYSFAIDESGIKIYAGDARGAFYAIQTLRQIVYTEKCFPYCTIYDKPDFAFRGLQNDTTRGRVPTVEGLKKIADMCAYLKINKLVLYFEHSLALREFECISTAEESLNADELREVVEYCRLLYIDVIPYLAMVGHQYKLLQHDKYKHLCELENYVPTKHYWEERMSHHSFDVSNPESFEMVKSFIDQLVEIFPSDVYIPGVDESWDLGKGKNAGCNVIEAYCSYLDKICDYLKKYNKTALIADDILQNHKGFLLKSDNTIMYHWDYEKEPCEDKYKTLYEKNLKFIAVPCTISYNGPIERAGHSVPNIIKTVEYAKKYGGSGIINTIWGDSGHWADFNCNLYGISVGAEKSWNNEAPIKDGTFESTFSALIYGERETSVKKLIGRIAVLTYNASGYYISHWCSDNLVNNKNTEFTLIEPETPHSYYIEKAIEAENEARALMEKHPEKSEFYESLAGAASITHTLNILTRGLTEKRRLTKEELDIVNERFEAYHKLWLRNNKESEFYENRQVVEGIIKYLERY